MAALLLLVTVTGLWAEDDDPEKTLRWRMRTLVSAGDHAGLLKTADEAIALREKSVLGWQYRAYALHRLRRLGKAREAYERTLELAPSNWWAAMNLADLHASEGRYSEGVKTARRAVRLNPKSTATHAMLSRIHRNRGAWASAAREILAALEAGADPAFCHAELGYLFWVLQDRESSDEHWRKAREHGADEEAVAHGLALLDWEKPRGSEKQKLEIARRRGGAGEEWVFDVGRVEVHTRVGPKLPRPVERLVLDMQKDFGKLLGVSEGRKRPVLLHLGRTVEEHEVHRRREFPAGYSGKAFLVTRRAPSPGRPGPRISRNAQLDLYVAWSAPGLVRGLSHELAHVYLRLANREMTAWPSWLDEGLAVYLERVPDARGRLVSRSVRKDLLDVLSEARANGRALTWRAMTFAQPAEFTGPDARARYAQAWSMVHFLVEGHGPGGASRFRTAISQMARMLRAGEKPVPLYTGLPSEMQAAWEKYVGKLITK